VRFERIGREFESLRGLHKYCMALTKKQLQEAIDRMVKAGQDKFATEGERRIYAYAFVRSMLTDMAMQDSDVLSKLIRKHNKIVK
jgi:hypothetical protein